MSKFYRSMIVEDEIYSARIIASYIKNYPEFYAPKIASSIAEARELLSKQNFDLLFLDLHLPDADSFDLLKAGIVHCPVILITGDSKQALAAFELNVADYIVKPVTEARFKKAMAKTQEIMAGRKELINRSMKSKNINQSADIFKETLILQYFLSPAEVAICRLIADGKKPTEIRSIASISINTYKSHLKRIYAKTIDRNQSVTQTDRGKLQQLTFFLYNL